MSFGFVLREIQVSNILASILKLVFLKMITLCDHDRAEILNKYKGHTFNVSPKISRRLSC